MPTDKIKWNRIVVGTGEIPGAKVAAEAVNIADDAVTTVKILDANVTAAKLAADAVETAKIKDSNVTAAKLASDAVTTVKILDANVTTAKIADSNVTAGKLASDSVETAKILALNVTGAKIAAATITNDKLVEGIMRISADISLTNEEILALQTTPKTLVANPGANKALIFLGAELKLVYSTAAFANIAAGDDLNVRYTNGSGGIVGVGESTGFLDLTADAWMWINPSASPLVTPNAALVLSLGGAVDTGGGTLKVRVYYRIVDTAFA
jgi:hypothetical protein